MNKGLNWKLELEYQTEQDWKLGATGLTCLAEIPEEEREKYLPKGELQFGREDFMDCVSRAVNNILETKFNYLIDKRKLSLGNHAWLLEKGYIVGGKVEFSDRFVAVNSSTTREGNSIKAPLDAVRKFGLIPKSKLPAESWMGFDDYHDKNKITIELFELGMEFTRRFFINYERGNESAFEELLKRDLLLTGGHAWPSPQNGEYPRTELGPNHSFMIWKRPRYFAFDNYLDEGKQNDWIKKLAPDFDLLDTGYRVLVNKESVTPQKKTIFQKLLEFLQEYNIFRIYDIPVSKHGTGV